jgi:hypothetical protein
MRERRLLCSSKSEPLGTNGFGLFIGLALVASFLRGLFFSSIFGFDFYAAKSSLEKFRNALNSVFSAVPGQKHRDKIHLISNRQTGWAASFGPLHAPLFPAKFLAVKPSVRKEQNACFQFYFYAMSASFLPQL